MKEMDDYSGAFDPDIKLEDLSKDFLIRLIRQYAAAYMRVADLYWTKMEEMVGLEQCIEDTMWVWTEQPLRTNPKYAKAANIKVENLVDCMKVWQVCLDGFIPGLYQPTFEIKGPNHVIMTMNRCLSHEYWAKQGGFSERIKAVCGEHGVEHRSMEPYLRCFLPNAQVRQLSGPPESGMPSKEGIACQWEYTLKPI